MDELCISRRRNLWLCVPAGRNATAVSRYTGQILAYLIGDRTWKHVEKLHALLPERYQRRRVYTDGYQAYSAFFWPSQHRVCQKFDGFGHAARDPAPASSRASTPACAIGAAFWCVVTAAGGTSKRASKAGSASPSGHTTRPVRNAGKGDKSEQRSQ